MNLEQFSLEQIDLKLPLLIIKGKKGFLACGYIDIETCNKTGEAAAIVSGVKTHEDRLTKEVIKASNEAKKLGIQIGMNGKEVLEII